jgi:ring-1,2-phenylacetyl-CoA epoxidase subunit PaaC
VAELFDGAYVDERLVADGVAVDPATLRDAFDQRIETVLHQATLSVPDVAPAAGGGRTGVHTDALAPLLAELQGLAREHPGATW